MERRVINYLSKNQVILALIIIVVGWFMLQIRAIIASIFISYILMAALLPFVTYLRKKGLPKLLAVLIVYFSIMIIGAVIIFPLIPFFTSQVQSLIAKFPHYLSSSTTALGLPVNAKQLQDYMSHETSNIGTNALFVTKQVFGGLFSTLTIIIVSFYLLLNYEAFRKWIAGFFHEQDREKAYHVFKEVDEKLGDWLRGQLLLSYIIGVVTLICLVILGVPNALPLAVIAGILEAFPTLGPILSAIPAVIVALAISPAMAITVVILYIVIQLLENNLIVPKVMEHAVGLNPIIVIVGVSTGATLMGITGALLAIPFISFLVVLVNSIRDLNAGVTSSPQPTSKGKVS